MNVAPEYLFQTIGEVVVEAKLLGAEISRLQQEIESKKRTIAGLQMEKAGDGTKKE